jgi:threonine dehydrogenase-like Zn-dependent dehydrogenase
VAGICRTDLEITRGYLGFVGTLGHELVAEVEQGPAEWRGRRVCCAINFACGRCPSCQRGLERHCPERTVLGIQGPDGAFSEQLVVPVAALHPIADDLDDEQAVFAEPLAAAFAILEQVHVSPGEEVLVLGDGKLGLLAAQVLSLVGARVLAVGKHDEHLAILRDRGIATALLGAWDREPRALVVEATGTAAGFALALAVTRPRGTLVLKSTVAASEPIDLGPLVVREIRVVGSRCGLLGPALAALRDGRVEVRALIAARYRLGEAVAAFAHAARPGTLKVLLCADGT